MRDFVKTTPPSPLIITLTYLGLNLATGMVAALLLTIFPKVSPFLLFFPTVVFVSWYSGFVPGFITTVISMIIIVILLFLPTAHPLLIATASLFVEMSLFFLIGTFTAFMVDKAKNQDVITGYQKKLRQNTHLIETLEKNYADAQQEIQARDQFLAIASHELKTPVTSMLLQVQTAIHNIRNVSLANFSVANLLKMLEGTEQQSQRLSKMVNDLLNLSLITTGKIDLEVEETDLSKIARHVADNFDEKVKRENTTITVTADKPIIGTWDKVRIEQAITNLLSNALKYGNNKPITMSVTSSHDHAKITVHDQGIGISHDQQKRIFDRFERAVSPKEYQGLGVGLYITNQIVKAHHGHVSVESQPNKGTSFVIELPLHPKKA